jgi:hypothetical protein
MPFMFLILAFLMGAVLWGFFHANPHAAPRGRLLACNAVIIVLAVAVALGAALPLHADALAQHPEQRFMAVYLAIMAGGAAVMLVLIAGGLVRNLLLFPRR